MQQMNILTERVASAHGPSYKAFSGTFRQQRRYEVCLSISPLQAYLEGLVLKGVGASTFQSLGRQVFVASHHDIIHLTFLQIDTECTYLYIERFDFDFDNHTQSTLKLMHPADKCRLGDRLTVAVAKPSGDSGNGGKKKTPAAKSSPAARSSPRKKLPAKTTASDASVNAEKQVDDTASSAKQVSLCSLVRLQEK